MRPIIFDITLTELTILFAGRPHLVASLRITGSPTTFEEAELRAVRDFALLSPRDIELVREIAKPILDTRFREFAVAAKALL
jgi:hypothetical protein